MDNPGTDSPTLLGLAKLDAELKCGTMARPKRKLLLSRVPGRLTFAHFVLALQRYVHGCVEYMRGTTAYTCTFVINPTGQTTGVTCFAGFALCSPKDMFCKKQGRNTALKELALLLQGTWHPPFSTAVHLDVESGSFIPKLRDRVRPLVLDEFVLMLHKITEKRYFAQNVHLTHVNEVLPQRVPSWLYGTAKTWVRS